MGISPGSSLTRPRLLGSAGIALALLLSLSAVWSRNPLVFFVPAAALCLPVFGLRILTNPVPVLSVFVLLGVNFDIVRFGAVEVSLHVILSALLMWALIVRIGLERRVPFRSPVERAFLVFLLVTLVSVALSVSPARSLKNWFRDLEYLVLFAFLMGLVLTPPARKALAAAVVFSSVIPCLSGIAGLVFDVPALYGLESPIAGGEVVRRVSGTLAHPVSLSIYLAVTTAVTLSLLMDGRWIRRTYLLAVLSLQLVVLYLTYGRTGWIVLLVSVVVLLHLSGHRRWLLLGLPAFLAAVAVLIPTFVARWQSAWMTEGENSFLWRIGLWAHSLTLIPNRPLFGSGPDTFTSYVAYETGKASHQTWIGLAIETGLVGLAAFVAVTITVIVVLRRLMRSKAWRTDAVARATVAVFFGLLAGSLAENPFEVPVIATLIWILLGITLSPGAVPGPTGRR